MPKLYLGDNRVPLKLEHVVVLLPIIRMYWMLISTNNIRGYTNELLDLQSLFVLDPTVPTKKFYRSLDNL